MDEKRVNTRLITFLVILALVIFIFLCVYLVKKNVDKKYQIAAKDACNITNRIVSGDNEAEIFHNYLAVSDPKLLSYFYKAKKITNSDVSNYEKMLAAIYNIGFYNDDSYNYPSGLKSGCLFSESIVNNMVQKIFGTNSSFSNQSYSSFDGRFDFVYDTMYKRYKVDILNNDYNDETSIVDEVYDVQKTSANITFKTKVLYYVEPPDEIYRFSSNGDITKVGNINYGDDILATFDNDANIYQWRLVKDNKNGNYVFDSIKMVK